jgi:hypothetical protein
MKAKERDEVIKVLEDIIKYIKANLDRKCFICNIIAIYLIKEADGGYNKRMLPQTLEYIKSQKPTSRMNKVIYDAPYYYKNDFPEWLQLTPWWGVADTPVGPNMERIRFLQHLINKLKK